MTQQYPIRWISEKKQRMEKTEDIIENAGQLEFDDDKLATSDFGSKRKRSNKNSGQNISAS